MPSATATEAEWEAWSDLQHVQAICAGLVSSSKRDRAGQRQAVDEARVALTAPGVQALLGDHLDAAHDLLTLLASGSS